MSTLFVERSGVCVGSEALISESSLIKVKTALPESERARLHWVVGYVGFNGQVSEQIREMGMWMDLFGHAREVGIDMAQIRSFIDGSRGERNGQKHEGRIAEARHSNGAKNGSDHGVKNSHGVAYTNGHSKKPGTEKKGTDAASPSSPLKTNGAKALHPGTQVRDLDPRRKRSGRIVEVGDRHAKIKWESGRVNEVSLDRLMMSRLFSLR